MTDEFICRAWGRVGWKRKSLPLGVDSGEARVYKNKIKRDIEVFLLARTLLLLLLLLFLLSSGNGLSGKEACTQCTRTHTHTHTHTCGAAAAIAARRTDYRQNGRRTGARSPSGRGASGFGFDVSGTLLPPL